MTDNDLQLYRQLPSSPIPARPLPPSPAAGIEHMIGEFLFLVCRHKWKIILCLLLGSAAAGYLWFKTPVVYRSEARLLVRYIADQTMSDPSGLGGRVMSPDSRGGNIINSEIGILTSRDLIENVVDEINPATLVAQTNQVENLRSIAITSVGANLQAQNVKNSNIIYLYYDAPNALQAQDVLSRITRLYLDKHVQVHQSGLAFEFLQQQTDQMAARLAATERELQAARAEIDVGDIDTAKENTRVRIADMNTQLFTLETQLAAVQARLDTLVQRSTDQDLTRASSNESQEAPPDPATAATISLLTSRLRRLRESELTLLATYTDQSPAVQNVRREIARVDEEWKQLIGTLPAHARLSLAPNAPVDAASMSTRIGNATLDAMTELAALNAQRTVTLRHLDDARQTALKIENAEAKIRRLQRRREIEDANYIYFSKNLEQARINDALDSSKITNINVVQKATLPLKGLRPELHKRMGIALAVGLLAGIGLAFATENGINGRWFTRPADVVSALGIPVLVSIPRIPRRNRRVRRSGKTVTVGVKTGPWASPEGFASYCELLRHRILVPNRASRKPLVLGITGCSHDAGVSTIASGIAMNIACEDATRVLLTTASLERWAEVFVNEQGRVTVTDWSRTVIERDDDGDVLPDVSSPALRFQALLSRIASGTHGCVVLDLPPVFEQGKALSIAALLDGVILIVKSEKDRRVVARHSLELLHETKVPVLGVVLNKYRRYVPKWLSNEI